VRSFRRQTSWSAVALALAVFFITLDAAAVECRLAPDGTITTWLLAGPYPLDLKAGFDKDLLPDKLAETSAFQRIEGAGPVAWRGRAVKGAYVDLSTFCRPRGESVFYLACELKARKGATYRLTAEYWRHLSVWLDGKRVVHRTAEDALLVSQAAADLPLTRGRTHHLLVKVGSRNQQAFLRLAIETAGLDRKPAPVDCVLRVPKERLGELIAGSLSLAARGGSIIRAGKGVLTTVRAAAGYPVVQGEVVLKAVILDHKGREVRTFKDQKTDGAALDAASLSLPWLVPKDSRVPRYTLKAEVHFAGARAGEVRRSFYLAQGIAAWAQDLSKRMQKIDLQLGSRRRYLEPDVALARLRLEKAVLHARGRGQRGVQPDKIFEELEGCQRALVRLEKQQARALKPGLMEFAYISPIDDAPQAYYVYVPAAHDGRTRRPCLVYLHGYSPDLDKLNWEMIPRTLFDYCDRHGVYLVAPFARSNTDFQAVGEVDVRHALMLAHRDLPIDAGRVFLFGYSMGAMGAFTLAAHYPDLWAGVVSISGRADYYLWKDYDRAKVEPYKRHLLDMEFGAQMLGNYRNLPILMYHGGQDSLIKVEQSRALLRRLKPLGADVTLHELQGEDHWIISKVLADDGAFKWMKTHKRNALPARVDFTSYSIKYRRAYWLTVIEMLRWGEPITVQAVFNADKTALRVTTQNVASLRLDLSKELVGEAPRLTVTVNGTERRVEAPGPQTFEIEPVKRVGTLRKTPRLCGPVKEAFNRRFALVIGTGAGTEADAERYNRDAVAAASEWYRFTKSMPIVKQDARVHPLDVRQSNLILYGKPSRNKILRQVVDKLPIKITDDHFEFQGKTYSTAEHGLVMVYPNPQSPTRYLVVRSGLPYGTELSENHKYDLLPDFVIFRKGTDYDSTDQAVVAGFFDENWQVAERLIWRRGKQAPDPRRVRPITVEEPPGPTRPPKHGP